MDAEIAEQLGRRDRFRNRLWALQTWDERLAALDRHQSAAAAAMRLSAEGYARYLRRNYRARSIGWTEITGEACTA